MRRLVGVMSADRTGNWRMADVLSLKLSNDSLLSRDLELRLMQEANRLERATKTADKRTGTKDVFPRGVHTDGGGGASYFGRRAKQAGAPRSSSRVKSDSTATAVPSSRGRNHNRRRRGGGGGGDQ